MTTDFEFQPIGDKPDQTRRRWWLWVLVVLASLLLLAAILVGAAYLYVTKLPLSGEARGRVNILVMGVDDAASLSDTLMLVSLDTRLGQEHPRAAMISIPRDLWVEVPEFGTSKINAAYAHGARNDYPGGGLALTRATVEQTFAIDIHYAVAMDFTGFRKAIDAVGGIEVDVKEDIYDPLYPDGRGGHQLYQITAGHHHLNGEQALKYARSRQTTTDFDRAARQQQIVAAFMSKSLNQEILTDRAILEELLAVKEEHFETDLSPRELAKLAYLSRRLDRDETITHVLSTDSDSFLMAAGFAGYVLVPRSGDFNQINQFIANIFDQPPAGSGD